ncbi:hypothetical protein J6590_103095 [Homalodisca vitripennis]|nr:hypothetical protein J6590_103095 [Homalodisca vitripennis]
MLTSPSPSLHRAAPRRYRPEFSVNSDVLRLHSSLEWLKPEQTRTNATQNTFGIFLTCSSRSGPSPDTVAKPCHVPISWWLKQKLQLIKLAKERTKARHCQRASHLRQPLSFAYNSDTDSSPSVLELAESFRVSSSSRLRQTLQLNKMAKRTWEKTES